MITQCWYTSRNVWFLA